MHIINQNTHTGSRGDRRKEKMGGEKRRARTGEGRGEDKRRGVKVRRREKER